MEHHKETCRLREAKILAHPNVSESDLPQPPARTNTPPTIDYYHCLVCVARFEKLTGLAKHLSACGDKKKSHNNQFKNKVRYNYMTDCKQIV